MKRETVGISDMAFYLPPRRIALDDLVARRVAALPGLARHLDRALRTTGQLAIRYPEAGEDAATMAAEAAAALLGRQAAGSGVDPAGLRFLVAGTESGLDHSKPQSAAVGGMLRAAGFKLPATFSSFQVQHACAGGALGALSVAGLLASGGRDGETGIVTASDVARYETESTAEVTQGAGTAALLIARDPALLELDLGSVGFASSDVDDFFRPMGADTARVNGRYSMECYHQALSTAFDDHAARRGLAASEVLLGADIVVLHAPFARMPVEAMNRLLGERLGLSPEGAAEYLAAKAFHAGLQAVAGIGNTYTASSFMALGWTLHDLWKRLGDGIVGKRLLFASYGSGNTMAVFTAVVAAGAPAVIARWKLDEQLAAHRDGAWEDYLAWTAESHGEPSAAPERARKAEGFRLESLRPDGYRVYGYAPRAAAAGADAAAEAAAAVQPAKELAMSMA